jgi:CheY-like chemotaxis protein
MAASSSSQEEACPAQVAAGMVRLGPTCSKQQLATLVVVTGSSNCRSTLAALEQLRTSPVPLVVVMNTRIPRVDAEGILRAVLAEPALQRHAFVLTTALAPMLPDELGRLTRLLEVPLVAKPFTEQELLAGVDAARRGLRTPRPTGR